jgi:hypothetical protein
MRLKDYGRNSKKGKVYVNPTTTLTVDTKFWILSCRT